MFRNFIFFVVCLFTLSGCAVPFVDSYNFISYSELGKVYNKTIYYEMTDQTIITERVNKHIQAALKLKGWKIIEKDKANYVYTVSTNIEKIERLNYHNIKFGSVFDYDNYITTKLNKHLFITIKNKVTNNNVYEAQLLLDNNTYYRDMPIILSKPLVLKHLFKDKDFGFREKIVCDKLFDGKTGDYSSIGECKFVSEENY